jgi:hypothetical protein
MVLVLEGERRGEERRGREGEREGGSRAVGNKPIHLVISTIKVIAASLAGPFELSSTGGNAEIISLIGNGRAPKSPMPSRMRLKQVGGILGCQEVETERDRERQRQR